MEDTITKSSFLTALEKFEHISLDDMRIDKLYRAGDGVITSLRDELGVIQKSVSSSKKDFLSFEWSLEARDFCILLRDSLLAAVRYDQFCKDQRVIDSEYLLKLSAVLQDAAQGLQSNFHLQKEGSKPVSGRKHEISPINEIVKQLTDLRIQCRKITESQQKINVVRSNISYFLTDFQNHFQIQMSGVKRVYAIISETKELVSTINENLKRADYEKKIDKLNEKELQFELLRDMESIEFIYYSKKDVLNFPVATRQGQLMFKQINIQSEFARWYSSYIYPQMVELESKRNLAVDKGLLALEKIKGILSAIVLDEKLFSANKEKVILDIIDDLEAHVVSILREEETEVNNLVTDHINNYLFASNLYNTGLLFLPESGSLQINNLSRDAQNRLNNYFQNYKNSILSYIQKTLARYIEIDKTTANAFISNKLDIDYEDQSLALFLKNGYLGRSFTLPRKEIVDAILDRYALWKKGFHESILVFGGTGRGKSTILAMLSQIGFEEEVIQLRPGESLFFHHQNYEVSYDLKEMIELLRSKTVGKKLIICIDDLEQWHDADVKLYSNISGLFDSIQKYREQIFFIVSSGVFIYERIDAFKKLDACFSYRVEVNKMSDSEIRRAIYLRKKAITLNMKTEELERYVSSTLREAQGNIGHAMLEYCRHHNVEYEANVKSQEFGNLIKSNESLLKFISTNHSCSIKMLSSSLSDYDFKETVKAIDLLVGQKVLIRQSKGVVSFNPYLIHTVENLLIKNRL